MDSSVHCTFFQSSKVQSLCCCVHFSLFNLFFFSNIVFLTDSLLLRPSERSLLLTLITDTEGLHVESQFGGYLFAHSWGPYQVLPPRSGWAWEQQHLRGRPMCLKTSRSEALLPEVVYRHTQDAALFFLGGGLPLCRGAVDVFYSSIRQCDPLLGQHYIWCLCKGYGTCAS